MKISQIRNLIHSTAQAVCTIDNSRILKFSKELKDFYNSDDSGLECHLFCVNGLGRDLVDSSMTGPKRFQNRYRWSNAMILVGGAKKESALDTHADELDDIIVSLMRHDEILSASMEKLEDNTSAIRENSAATSICYSYRFSFETGRIY